MQIGYSIPSNRGVADPVALLALAKTAEALGCHSVWVSEHLFHSAYVAERLGDRPYWDPLTMLTAAACATSRVRLGTSVLVLPWHDPPRLGKMIATLDHLSGGRVDFGVGVATTEDEFNNLGVDFKTRGKRTNEVLGALQALWTQDVPEFQGEFYTYSGLKFAPKPLQKPYPPILVGGSSPAALRRIVRYGDGWHTLRQSPDEFAAGLARLKDMMAEAGRDPAVLKTSISLELRFDDTAPSRPANERRGLSGTDSDVAETLRAFRDAGVGEAVISIASADTAEHEAMLTRLMTRVAPQI
ncbi:MAG: LLM class F420-dependent oxidoreductase [Alphaproteobacteria bacterium]|nr:LLM class F420-dependent oxidoreductase [Alphaproteobacteria bacterium]MCB9927997.1 LLM class F420-dependent oxidoreductase [Alphaproteobacteria bacterium]